MCSFKHCSAIFVVSKQRIFLTAIILETVICSIACGEVPVSASDIELVALYNQTEDQLLKNLDLNIKSGSTAVLEDIAKLGCIRSIKAIPLLIQNIDCDGYPPDEIKPSHARMMLLGSGYPSVPALMEIGIPMKTCVSGTVSSVSGSMRGFLFTLLGVTIYDGWYSQEMAEYGLKSFDTCLEKANRSSAVAIRSQSQITNTVPVYHQIEDILLSRYYSALSSKNETNITACIIALGNIRSLRARPLALEYLRKTTGRSSVMLAHQRALRAIGLPLHQVMQELNSDGDNLEWIEFLLGIGWDIEGKAFTRAMNRYASRAADTGKWKYIQKRFTVYMEAHSELKQSGTLPCSENLP